MGDPHASVRRAQFEQEQVLFMVTGDGAPLVSAVASWDQPVVELDADVRGVDSLLLEAHVIGGPSWLHGGAAWLVPQLGR